MIAEAEGLALEIDTLWIVLWGLIIGVAAVYVRRAVRWFQMRTGGKW